MKYEIVKYNGLYVVEITDETGTYQLCPEKSFDIAELNKEIIERIINRVLAKMNKLK